MMPPTFRLVPVLPSPESKPGRLIIRNNRVMVPDRVKRIHIFDDWLGQGTWNLFIFSGVHQYPDTTCLGPA